MIRQGSTPEKSGNSPSWSVDRILELGLSIKEIDNLEENARKSGRTDVVQMCDDAKTIIKGRQYENQYLKSGKAAPKELVEVFFQCLTKYQQLKGNKHYPARTMQMIKNHGVIETIRRTGTHGPTATMEFMASKDCLSYTSEWLITHTFAEHFSEEDREKAFQRLKDAGLVVI